MTRRKPKQRVIKLKFNWNVITQKWALQKIILNRCQKLSRAKNIPKV